MADTMSPSEITAGQIGKICEILSAKLRKSGLRNYFIQYLLQNVGEELATDLLQVVKDHVAKATFATTFVRVKVNRQRSPQEALIATGRGSWDDEIINNMPRGEGEEVDLVIFGTDWRDCWVNHTDEDVAREYEIRGLKPADPYSLSAYHEKNRSGDTATHWKDDEGRWCRMIFDDYDSEHDRWPLDIGHPTENVYLYRYGINMRFAGIRK